MASVVKRSLLAGIPICVALGLVVLSLWTIGDDARGQEASPTPSPSLATRPPGEELFLQSCASCHGRDAGGTDEGPSLEDVGAAAVDFQLRTGRMPLADPGNQTVRKPPAFSEDEIVALVAYVSAFGDGPEIPDVALEGADLSAGQALFVSNCAPCHGATANGGAVGPGALAPSLFVADPVEVAEAIITGPGEMPLFAFSDEERNDIVAFIDYLQDEPAPGGADIGGVGPVPEGFVAWAFGSTALVVACLLLGTRMRRGRPGDEETTG
ncbi:MAG TPA: c-type cytochrome [Actinomycetota bacterium]|nr:c-type cytochrome [Actinomycetota bacterium]